MLRSCSYGTDLENSSSPIDLQEVRERRAIYLLWPDGNFSLIDMSFYDRCAVHALALNGELGVPSIMSFR